MLDGLLVASAAINASSATLRPIIPFIIVFCCLYSASVCLLCMKGQRILYLALVNIAPERYDQNPDPQKIQHYNAKYKSGFYRWLTEYSQRGTRSCYVFLVIAAIFTLICFIPKSIFESCPLQSLIFR